jgi:CheY-like chemotaxis protein
MLAPADAPTVLIVDDERSLRLYMARVLEDDGYAVLEAANGLEALSLLDDPQAENVRLVITDVLMPGMDGMDLATHLAGRTPSLPVLFISGSHSLSDVPGPLLPKPFLPADLRELARGLLRPGLSGRLSHANSAGPVDSV